ncbi:MAG TPA: transposase, partial [Usitatibacter sp.]|nr:transposase [Usitatibacter sp.]
IRMPRRRRLQIAGIPVHVVQRGVNRARCFDGHESYHRYLALLEETSCANECEVHAYVLMTNHVHLLMTPHRPDSISAVMKNLGQQYVQGFNRTRKRSGPLWEGRFHSSLVDSAGYLLRCQRYIELNPVRAGMVPWPEQYQWSSYRANALGEESAVVSAHPYFMALATSPDDRRREYRRLFGVDVNGEIESIRHALNAGYPLGSLEFLARLKRLDPRLVAQHRGRPRRPKDARRDAFRQMGKGV